MLFAIALIAAAGPIGMTHKTVKDLEVTQSFESGGTTHIAKDTTLSRGDKQLVVPGHPGSDMGPYNPMIDYQLPLGDNAWLLLGWFSFGSGYMDVEAIIVREGKALEIVDRLVLHTPRWRSGIALKQTSSGWQLGLPHYAPMGTHDGFGPGTVSVGKRVVNIGSELDRWLKPIDTDLVKVWSYHPPFEDDLPSRSAPSTPITGVAWLDVTPSGFRP
jgi:hypothetical protein